MDLQAVNSMSYERFLDVFGNMIEKCPLIAAAIWSKRPFSSVDEMEEHVYEFIESLPISGKEGILRCHPDLAGRELTSGTLTIESQHEQRQAGLTSLSPREREKLALLNSQYKDKFGFPFVICAKMSDKDKIMKELSSRLQNDPSQELLRGVDEVTRFRAPIKFVLQTWEHTDKPVMKWVNPEQPVVNNTTTSVCPCFNGTSSDGRIMTKSCEDCGVQRRSM